MSVYNKFEFQIMHKGNWTEVCTDEINGSRSKMTHLLGHRKSQYLHPDTEVIMDEPRGLPNGSLCGEWEWNYLYGRSWVLGSEFMDFVDADVTVIGQGCLSAAQYAKWDGKESDMIFGHGSGVTVPMSEAKLGVVYDNVLVNWETTRREAMGELVKIVEELMDEYGEVRIIYGFDQ